MDKISDRYIRQELVLGKEGQAKLAQAKVAIIGLGALGSVSSQLLARAGLGRLLVIDRDRVELTNLQRQVLYGENDIGLAKAQIGAKRLGSINSDIEVEGIVTDLNYKNIDLLLGCNLILDCSDNLYTRYLINDFSLKNQIPWIYAAAVKDYGNVYLVEAGQPCFSCLFEDQGITLDTCETTGVLSPLTTVIGSMQAQFAIDFLLGKSGDGKLLHFDLSEMAITKIKASDRSDCKACASAYEYLDGKKELEQIHYRCSQAYEFFKEGLDFSELKAKLSKLGEVKGDQKHLFFKGLSVFDNGRVMIKAESMEQAKSDLAKYIGV